MARIKRELAAQVMLVDIQNKLQGELCHDRPIHQAATAGLARHHKLHLNTKHSLLNRIETEYILLTVTLEVVHQITFFSEILTWRIELITSL